MRDIHIKTKLNIKDLRAVNYYTVFFKNTRMLYTIAGMSLLVVLVWACSLLGIFHATPGLLIASAASLLIGPILAGLIEYQLYVFKKESPDFLDNFQEYVLSEDGISYKDGKTGEFVFAYGWDALSGFHAAEEYFMVYLKTNQMLVFKRMDVATDTYEEILAVFGEKKEYIERLEKHTKDKKKMSAAAAESQTIWKEMSGDFSDPEPEDPAEQQPSAEISAESSADTSLSAASDSERPPEE